MIFLPIRISWDENHHHSPLTIIWQNMFWNFFPSIFRKSKSSCHTHVKLVFVCVFHKKEDDKVQKEIRSCEFQEMLRKRLEHRFFFLTLRIRLYVLRKGIPLHPILFGWDWDHQSYSWEGSGFLGKDGSVSNYPSQCFDVHLCLISELCLPTMRFSCGVADIIANDQTLLDVEKTLKQAAESLGGMTFPLRIQTPPQNRIFWVPIPFLMNKNFRVPIPFLGHTNGFLGFILVMGGRGGCRDKRYKGTAVGQTHIFFGDFSRRFLRNRLFQLSKGRALQFSG